MRIRAERKGQGTGGQRDLALADVHPREHQPGARLRWSHGQGAFKVMDEPLGSDQFGFIFKQGSDLVAPFNAAIAALKADGTFDKLNQKWFYEYQAQQ